MKDTARKKDARQEAPPQLVFAAMLDARATLHDAIVSAGMSVLGAMLEEERPKLCGPRYAHDPARLASRAGHTDGELALGGRRVRVRRPRVRGIDGAEIPLETRERFAKLSPSLRALSSKWCSASRRGSTFDRSSLRRLV